MNLDRCPRKQGARALIWIEAHWSVQASPPLKPQAVPLRSRRYPLRIERLSLPHLAALHEACPRNHRIILARADDGPPYDAANYNKLFHLRISRDEADGRKKPGPLSNTRPRFIKIGKK